MTALSELVEDDDFRVATVHQGFVERVDGYRVAGVAHTAAEALTEAGAEVVAVAVIVDRGGREAVEVAGYPYRAAFSLADLGLS